MRRLLIGLGFLAGFAGLAAAQNTQTSPPAAGQAVATFAGGCFWCTESDFDHVPGVISTTSGYTGGKIANPTYEQVSGGRTGHAEAVEVVYDPSKVSYEKLLAFYWRTVDPTVQNAQFCDHGEQYRTAIFVRNDDDSESLLNFTMDAGDVVVHRVAKRFVLRRGKLTGCIVNQGFAGGGSRLDSGTVAPDVERRVQGAAP